VFPPVTLRHLMRIPRLPTPSMMVGLAQRTLKIRNVSPGALSMLLPEGRGAVGPAPRVLDALVGPTWSAGPLRICAVRRNNWHRHVFDPATGEAPLSAMIGASCAVPGYFAGVRINGDTYLDGGVVSRRTQTCMGKPRHRSRDRHLAHDRSYPLVVAARADAQTVSNHAQSRAAFARAARDPCCGHRARHRGARTHDDRFHERRGFDRDRARVVPRYRHADRELAGTARAQCTDFCANRRDDEMTELDTGKYGRGHRRRLRRDLRRSVRHRGRRRVSRGARRRRTHPRARDRNRAARAAALAARPGCAWRRRLRQDASAV